MSISYGRDLGTYCALKSCVSETFPAFETGSGQISARNKKAGEMNPSRKTLRIRDHVTFFFFFIETTRGLEHNMSAVGG